MTMPTADVDDGNRTNGGISNLQQNGVAAEGREGEQQHNAIVTPSDAATPVDINSWTYIANHDTETEMVQRWKESKFAVGLTHPTWKDEPIVWCCSSRGGDADSTSSTRQCCTPLNITAMFCRNAGRVGNMIVLYQRTVSYYDPITSTTTQRPKLVIVLGPYWMVLLFVTVPIFVFFTCITGVSRLRRLGSMSLLIVYIVCTTGLFLSLFMVGCRNPGILYRHPTQPASQPTTYENDNVTDNDEMWIWNDQALTYRPKHAKYDSECAVVIEHFDHTCPWTGTAIGRNNLFWFRCFCAFVVADLLFNAILLSTTTIQSATNTPD